MEVFIMNNTITIVSGLPRSGTSMMMKMLEAGGMEVVVDNVRQADDDNPQGYYELERVKQIKQDTAWLDSVQGKAVKMVSMLLYDLPADRNYNILFMKRDIDEILVSQRIMLERKGEGKNINDGEMKELFTRHLLEIAQWLYNQNNMRVLFVDYKDIIDNPRENARIINEHLGNCLITDDMVRAVDTSLYRQRCGNLLKSDGTTEDKKSLETIEEQEKKKIEEQLRSLGYM
jgi:hypothetical protein